jgi:Protein of unknown function (DUF1501)
MSKWLHDVPTLTRRNLLRVGAVAISGFDLMPMLRPLNATVKEKVKPRGTAEYCLYVFLQGGCSHVDSFDLKEGKWTPPDFEVKQVAQGVKMPVGLFPKLSRDFKKIAILRSLETWETEHERAIYYMHAAHGFSPARVKEIPSVGAIVAYESSGKRKATDFLPPFMSMNYGPNQVKQGCLEAKYGPVNLDTRGGDLSFVVPQEEKSRFERRIAYLNELSKLSPGAIVPWTAPLLQANSFRADALGMMESPEIPKILKLEDEDKKRYGSSGFGDACVLARNILAAERGARFVAINHGAWDLHTNIYDKEQKSNQYTLSRDLDTGLSELMADMEKTKTADGRTLLEKTLIVCVGEFGRTPGNLTVGNGRDHHRFAMSAVFAGAGVIGGRALGATDEEGGRVLKPGWAKKRSMYPEDVTATIYSALGIDWSKEITHTPSGRVFEYIEFQSGTSFLDVSEIDVLFA